MTREQTLPRAREVLDAWNCHDVEAVTRCYTPDCIYRDPNTRGQLVGREAFAEYLSRLFAAWRMHWSLAEFFDFADGGGAFLWRATLTPSRDGATAQVQGMDLVLLRGRLLYRNEVYFDRMQLAPRSGRES